MGMSLYNSSCLQIRCRIIQAVDSLVYVQDKLYNKLLKIYFYANMNLCFHVLILSSFGVEFYINVLQFYCLKKLITN